MVSLLFELSSMRTLVEYCADRRSELHQLNRIASRPHNDAGETGAERR